MNGAETLSATEIGWLQGGDWGAVIAGLAMLHTRGVLATGSAESVGRDRASIVTPSHFQPDTTGVWSDGDRQRHDQRRLSRFGDGGRGDMKRAMIGR
ncbi:hypothetical protein [Micromonospora chersina]|uniref:hypothetical protein n=1 Tax=Micromonospora chersina TaxID=47854 RepID=UPI00371F9EB9